MNLQIHRIAYPVLTLGPGRRLGLWAQGCTRHCVGCASRGTWDPAAGESWDVEELAHEIAALISVHCLEGLSLSGGEPADQAEPLAQLVTTVRDILANESAELSFNVLVFSGYSINELLETNSPILNIADALVCGPYDQVRPRAGRLVASDNQQLVVLNEAIRSCFDDYNRKPGKSLQFDIADSGISIIGMPEAGDLDRIVDSLKRRGVQLEGLSWRS